MKNKYFKTNKDYFNFINLYKSQIEIYEVTFTKTRLIKLSYDII